MGDIPQSNIDRLVVLAVINAVHEALPKTRQARLVTALLAIAADWEREDNVIDMAHPRPVLDGSRGLNAAAARLRWAAQMLRPPDRRTEP